MNDVFCKIINKEIPAEIIAEEEDWLAIKDIHPQAPVHVLIIPKKHLANLAAITETEVELMGRLLLAANKIAKKMELDKKGFRLIINHGEDGGQVVEHLHLHLLGGRQLGPKIVRDPQDSQ